MLLLFAGGVMNLTVILALTAFVLVEKLTPFGARTAMCRRRAVDRRGPLDAAALKRPRGPARRPAAPAGYGFFVALP